MVQPVFVFDKEVIAGALVRCGEAVAEVTATGASTKFGRTAELVRPAHVESSQQTGPSTHDLIKILLIGLKDQNGGPESGA